MGRVCCFTGHRPKSLYGYIKSNYYPLFNKLEETVTTAIEQGFDTFITGGAQGIDQLAFWVVNKLKKTNPNIKNIVYVPFKGQEERWSEFGLFSKEDYRKMLSLADEVKYLKSPNKNNYKEVIEALTYRNHRMCNDSELIIGVSKPNFRNKDKSGTFECLRYAEDLGLPIILIDKDTLNISGIPPKPRVAPMFRDDYYFLSNMYPCKIEFNGRTFKCSETAFHTESLSDESDKDYFSTLDGYESKAQIKVMKIRKDWDKIKVDTMAKILIQKFLQNKDLALKLIETEDTPLIEYNNWGDCFWGVCGGKGDNTLGKLLMLIRDNLNGR